MSLDAQPTTVREISRVEELLSFFQEGERTGAGLIGLEHEKFIYPKGSTEPVPYEGPSGIGALMQAFSTFGWVPYREAQDRPVIAMTKGRATLSLEPGGQFELSGSPFATAREAQNENLQHLWELTQLCDRLGLRAVTLGYRPHGTPASMPWMPKSRYGAMRSTLGARGRLSHHMMLMTSTGQVSIDWKSEADCARKVVLAARLAPVLVALYANSPMVDGKPSGFVSFRSHVWNEVDPSRCGFPGCFFDGSFSYRAYTEWALDAPMLFLRRNGEYLVPKTTFREHLQKGHGGHAARWDDWVDHLSTLFPEVRIKKVMEVRSADCVSPELTGALPALIRGLFYAPASMDALEQLLKPRSKAQHLELQAAAQKDGLEAKGLAEVSREVIAIAQRGLKSLDPMELPLLEPLEEIARGGKSPARLFSGDGIDANVIRVG